MAEEGRGEAGLSFEWPFLPTFPEEAFADLAAAFPARVFLVFNLTIGFQYGFLGLAYEHGASDGWSQAAEPIERVGRPEGF